MKNNGNSSLASQTKNVLSKNNIKLKSSLGQNFLIDDNKQKQIINFANLTKKDTVLEIGPGIGTLSLELAKHAFKVICIEQDKLVADILESRIEENSINNIEIINEDALKVDFPKFNKVVSNLPYQISSPITFKLLDYSFDKAVLMYQKEFADRMLSTTGEKNYSRLSVMLAFRVNVEFLMNVPKECYMPKPKVNSTVVKLTPNYKYNLENKEDKQLFEYYAKIAKALFQHKNKKAENALINSRHEIGYNDKKELKKILEDIKTDKLTNYLSQRPVNLSPEEILELTKLLKDFILI